MFKILIEKNAEKDIKKLPKYITPVILDKIKSLSSNPLPENNRKLKGVDNFYRLREGNYRIIYKIDKLNKTILIYKIKHRKDAYSDI